MDTVKKVMDYITYCMLMDPPEEPTFEILVAPSPNADVFDVAVYGERWVTDKDDKCRGTRGKKTFRVQVTETGDE